MNAKPSRIDVEEAVLATLYQYDNRLQQIIDRLDLKLFQIEVNQRVAEKLIFCFRLFKCNIRRGIEFELHDDEEGLRVLSRVLQREALPKNLDLLEVLAGRQEIPPPEVKPAAEGSCAPMSEFAAARREWLWPGRIELGQLTLLGGEPGSGKSLIACDLAARITAGGAWPDTTSSEAPGEVLFVASGDDVSNLFRPRLEAAGADIRRMHVLPVAPSPPVPKPGERSPFKKILKALEEALSRLAECRLVIVDPLRLSIGHAQTTIGGDPAAPLELLAAVARRRHVALLGVAAAVYEDRRRNNLAAALKAATGASAAAAWHVVRHPHQKHLRLFLPAKTTRSSDLEGLAFRVIDEPAGERVQWQAGLVPADSMHLLPCDDAAAWLRQALADGRLASKELFDLGQRNGYTRRMLHKAKPLAGVDVVREGFGPGAAWHWVLTNSGHAKTA